jgi:hypothetical protein
MAMPIAHPKALDTRIPFTRADARAAGLTEGQLRTARFAKVFYDLYVASDIPITPEIRAKAALRGANGAAYISHWTAAELWRLPVPHSPDTHISVLDRSARCSRQGVRSHLSQPTAKTTMCRGIRLTTPEQTFLDLAGANLSLIDLVILGDAMVKKELTSLSRLISAVETWSGAHRNAARRAARLVREGVDSPMETRLRLLLVLAGLPEPSVNLIIRAADGTWRLRCDLCYEHCRVIVEYDGQQHREDPDQWESDIYRREELETRGYRLIIVTKRGIYKEPDRTIARVRKALVARGAELPPRLRDEWRRYFPVYS